MAGALFRKIRELRQRLAGRLSSPLLPALGRVRRKLQRERLLKGLALLLGGFVLVSAISAYLLTRDNFSDSSIFWVRLLGGLGLLIAFAKYVFQPASSPPSQRQIARFLEERHPSLEDRLSTAVEVAEESSRVHPTIRDLVQEDAWSELRKLPQTRFYRPQATLLWILVLTASLLVFSYLFFAGPQAYQYTLSRLLWGWFDRHQPPLYSISVTPGDTKVGKRSDVEIRAALQGFDSRQVRLFARYENSPQWEWVFMQPAEQGNQFAFLFFDVRDRIDYYVEASAIRSDTYTIQVAEIPRVEELQIVLKFPAYTGLQDLSLKDSGDIRALAGTRAEFRVKADQPVRAGKIRLEKGGEIALQPQGERELTGALQVQEDDYYRFHLQDLQQFWNPASDEYLIEALPDQPPVLTFVRPGRDQKVTNIEEVFTELKVEDDHGIRDLALRFSVNGGPEREAPLSYPRGSRSFTSAHTFYLEEFELEPGDFVSYYAEARDAVASSATDIYFFEVEPYDREYYQAQQGGLPGGAGNRDHITLSRRQKEIIAATFKLERDRQQYSASEFEENSQTLALVQQRLSTEAQTIVDRIQRRGAAASDSRFQKMAEHLKQATLHMEPAQLFLNQQKPEQALPEEQKSFQQLLRAEALFKEIQVAFAQSQAGGAGNASAEELANLVDLELDKTKNQYETLQQNQQASREQALDEALEKLKELAKRQEQAAERRRQQALQGSSGASNLSQDQLIEEVEKLARQLQRLSRQQQDQRLADISRQLREAAREMRQAQQQAGQNSQESQLRAQRAVQRLRQAYDSLNRQRQESVTEGLERLRADSERLVEKQKEVIDAIGQLRGRQQAGKIDQDFLRDLRNLLREKSALQSDLQKLEADLHHTARQIESPQPAASRQLKQAGLEIRDQRIPEKMQEGSELLSRGWTDLARQREETVERDLEEVARKIGQAEQALGDSQQANPQENLQRALREVGNLVENLESLRERALDSGSSPDTRSRAAEQGQERPQEDEPGRERSGQQGQAPSSDASRRGDQLPAGTGPQTSASQAGILSNTTGINPRQVQREWQERLRQAQDIGGMLEANPHLAREIGALVREMRRLDSQRLLADPEEIARLKSHVIDGLRQLELEINRQLQQEAGNLLRLVGDDEVPPEFRNKVEDYYRALSSRKQP